MYSQSKIEEAEFFLTKLELSEVTSAEFTFYFSATVSAFRSITFAFQKSYRANSGFEDLYKEYQEELKASRFASSLVQARNITQKQGSQVPITVYAVTNLDSGDSFRWELDSLPYGSHNYVGFEINRSKPSEGEEVTGVIPCGMSERDMKAAASVVVVSLLRDLEETDNKSVECYIKLEPKGEDYSIGDFFARAKTLLSDMKRMMAVFECNWPTKSAQESMKNLQEKR